MTTDASRRAVFDTSELLERIISFVPAREILTKVQRVSRTWKIAVNSSPTLQTILWRKSQATQALPPTGFPGYSGAKEHSLGFKLMARLGVGLPLYSGGLAFNEILLSSHNVQSRSLFVQSVTLEGMGRLVRTAFTDHILDQESHGAQPTWLGMYITEPPITVARIAVYLPDCRQSRKSGDWIEVTVCEQSGPRFATALTVVDKMRKSLPSTWDIEPYYRMDPMFLVTTDGPVHGTGVSQVR